MAADQTKPTTGGNKPRPPAPATGASGQSAKDRSKAQSRSVAAKSGATKKTAARGSVGGNTPRPGSKPAVQPTRRGISGTMMAWGAVGLVIVVIAVLVIVKVAGSGNPTGPGAYTPVTPAPANVVHDVTNIPASVYNQIGVTSPTVQVSPPTILSGQPPLTIDGQTPAMLYYGAEYCPYCAAERWAMTAALSRFGTWSNLKITASSHTDVDAETNTFSYYGASLSSPYITFKGIEAVSNVPNASGYYNTLMTPTKQEYAVVTKYESPTYLPGSNGQIGFPFVSINNLAIIGGPSYDPTVLAGQSWSEIASGLSNPNNPATQAIVTTANYISAAICASSKGAPASVCDTPGVKAAAKALKLPSS